LEFRETLLPESDGGVKDRALALDPVVCGHSLVVVVVVVAPERGAPPEWW